MTTTVELGALKPIVDDLVAKGRYGSKSEVLRAGVRMVHEHEARLTELLTKLQEGVDALDAGEFSDLEDFRKEMLAQRQARGG